MSETRASNGRKKCDFHQEIGSGYCDNCGRRAHEHLGIQAFKKGASPFGTDQCWENLTWAEWKSRRAEDERIADARARLAQLPDDEAVALADGLS